MRNRKSSDAYIFTPIFFILCAAVATGCWKALGWEGSFSFELSLIPGWPSSLQTQWELEFVSETWGLALETSFEGSDWNKLEIAVEGGLGELALDSELEFEPDKDRWRHWEIEIEWNTDSMTLGATWKLSRTTDWLTLEMEQEFESADVGANVRLRAPTRSCTFAFYDAALEVGFTWRGIETEIALEFDDDGFDELAFELSDVTLAGSSRVFFDIEILIDLAGWEFDVDPVLNIEIEGCLEIEIEAELPGFPHLDEIREAEIAASWECGPLETETTIRLDPDDWIDDLY